ELPSLIAATMRSRRSPDSGAGMTSPPTHQNRLPRISIPDSAQHKSALVAGPRAARHRLLGDRGGDAPIGRGEPLIEPRGEEARRPEERYRRAGQGDRLAAAQRAAADKSC